MFTMISKTEKLRNVRWKTFVFLNPEAQGREYKETYEFCSVKTPPEIHKIKEF